MFYTLYMYVDITCLYQKTKQNKTNNNKTKTNKELSKSPTTNLFVDEMYNSLKNIWVCFWSILVVNDSMFLCCKLIPSTTMVINKTISLQATLQFHLVEVAANAISSVLYQYYDWNENEKRKTETKEWGIWNEEADVRSCK